jgi:hypothetical protein
MRGRNLLPAAVLLTATCVRPPTYPGPIVLGTMNLVAVLQSSDCPFDRMGSHIADGGPRPGASPYGLYFQGVIATGVDRREIYFSWNGADRLGCLDLGCVDGDAGFMIDTDPPEPRQVCEDPIDLLDERLVGTFYGPPLLPYADGGCPALFGPGLFPDAGIWPLMIPQLEDGGSLDGGGPINAGASSCFYPRGLLAGAQFFDLWTVPPDAGRPSPDSGYLCSSATCVPGLLEDGGPDGCLLDAGFMLSCTATYSLTGTFEQ